ncbi:hypothetical protein DPMN_148615 [Dreissena polymorpha]|uniref:Uncharacterized protein n=1 Tax=Dreissena polymorpha TaxID=45954 RepID=A0A9D4F9X4_DREPO|nr:hypothetical protein DPMN_148615 [Dreissena polymorpha]
MADNTAEYDLYHDLTDDRLFSINISHKFGNLVVNFTVKGKELEKTKASTSQAHVYIGIGLGAVVLFTAAVIIFIKQKRRRHNTHSFPMADPALTPIDAGRGNQTLTGNILNALQTVMCTIQASLLTKRMSQRRAFSLTSRNKGSH